jgi:hypothetical protein
VRYDELMSNRPYVNQLLLQGAERARAIARPLLNEIRKAVGANQ